MRASFTMLNNTEEEKNWCGQKDGNDEHLRFKMPFDFIALDYKKDLECIPVRTAQRNRNNTRYLGYLRRHFLQQLAYVFIKAKKSHALPSASWRTRKVGGKTQFKSKGLRISGLIVVPDDRKGKINCSFLNV